MVWVPREDRDGLHTLFAEYAWALDSGDRDGVLAAFAADGEMVQASRRPERRFSGHDAIGAFVDELYAWSRFPGRQHHLSNLLPLAGEPGKWWQTRSYVAVTEFTEAETTMVFIGWYDDMCVAADGRWSLKLRRYSLWERDAGADLPGTALEPPMPEHGEQSEREAIEDLITRSVWALDTGNGAAFAGCFTTDGELTMNGPEGQLHRSGSEQLAEFVAARRRDRELDGTQHHTGQFMHADDPLGREGHRLVRTYVFTTRCEPQPPHPTVWAGCFEDIVQRQADGSWRLLVRAAKPWAGELLSNFDSAAA